MSNHQLDQAPLRLECSQARAVFPDQGIGLSRANAFLLLDEHGGTFVLRVEDLEVAESGVSEAGVRLEIAVKDAAARLSQVAEFAARQRLPLTPPAAPLADLTEQPLLCACHVPAKSLFIFSETSPLTARLAGSGQRIELTIPGPFQARRLPSRDTDLVVHLAPAAMARFLSWVAACARSAR